MTSTANRREGPHPAVKVSRAMLETAHSLSVDLVTAEVVSAFRDRGIDSILLKGPSITHWLYRDGASRPYGDCDLLVPPGQKAEAEETLVSLGFRYGYESLGAGQLEEGLFWTRRVEAVDLHTTLQGIKGAPESVWTAFSEHVETTKVGGLEVNVLEPTARAMHVALHAAQHGRREATTMRDLERALEMLPYETWGKAAVLAKRLDASMAFATGLSLLPAGEVLVTHMGLDTDKSVEGLLFAESAPTVAFTLEQLRNTPGPMAKMKLVARKAFPNRAYMRLYWPVARRGRAGLVVAYCRRMSIKLGRLPAALTAWSRARRASR